MSPPPAEQDTRAAHPLALPAPVQEQGRDTTTPRTLNVQEENRVALDELGPLIVNSDGTLSRISNWKTLSPLEQERMVRLIVKRRNVQRLDKLKDEQGEQEEEVEGKEGGAEGHKAEPSRQ
ncbi:hypothetical protein NliqN6_1584 [Naganishia liquefaciens]|uniref:Uncharacterized protein n=1 Tax=Naganishia liquefaciens TaxID=104408 RepID=A0A8H3YEF1_9TREE|nr:hypothetical protein NliqN6_1584 [Naganishia liquefaciens]